MKKKTLAALAATVCAFTAFVATAPAQTEQDGLVNVVIEDSLNNLITIEDVNVGVAANIAANICGVKVGPVAVLGQAVDRSGATRTVCEAGGNTIRLTQN
jgi:catabolite regulation protein CreA